MDGSLGETSCCRSRAGPRDSRHEWRQNREDHNRSLVVVLLLAVPATLFILSGTTTVQVTPEVKAIGESTPVRVVLTNPHGVRAVKAIVEQDGKDYPIAGPQEPAHRFRFFKNAPPSSLTLNVGKGNAPALHDGKAKLIVEAQSNDFRGESSSVSYDVDVITRPPHVVADGVQHYVNQAGCGLVTFTPSGYVSDSGVQVKDYTFRSFPLPKHPNERFSLFAYPWDLPLGIQPVVFASNPAGAKATAVFYVKLFPKKFKDSTIVLTDAFMQKVLGDMDPENKIPGDTLARFIYCNREMRKQNSKTLYDLRPENRRKPFLWKGAFVRPPTKNESFFADRRKYTYNGKGEDVETHLGFDLADRPNTCPSSPPTAARSFTPTGSASTVTAWWSTTAMGCRPSMVT